MRKIELYVRALDAQLEVCNKTNAHTWNWVYLGWQPFSSFVLKLNITIADPS
jgi:hypothetical protein